MTASFMLRVLAGVAAVQFIGHGALFVTARPRHGAEEVAVVTAMQSHAFKFAAAPRTYWDMYFGYGLEAAFVCLVEALLFWLLAPATASNPSLVRSIAVLFAIGNVAHMAMLLRYFAFPLPIAFDAVIAIGLAIVAAVA